MRASSAFSMYGLVTSRSALAAESCAAIFATRVLRCTCTPRYHNEATTPKAPIACAIALIASQFIRCLPRRRSEPDWHFGEGGSIFLKKRFSFLLVRDLENNFASGMTRRDVFQSLGCIGQRMPL